MPDHPVSPFNGGVVLGNVQVAGSEDVENAVAAAKKACKYLWA